jgi:nitrogen regulatory protein P-II 1
MQALFYITNHEDTIHPIMTEMAERGIRGATVIDCEGMLKSLNEDSVDAPAIFGGLRQFANPGRARNKIILVVLKDEEIQDVVNVIHEVCGNLQKPNTGIVFTVPVTRWEVTKA